MKIQKKTGIDSLKLLREALQKSGSTYLPNADYIAVKNATDGKIDDISSIVNDPNYTELDSKTRGKARGKTRGKILEHLQLHPETTLTDLAKELQISYKGIEWQFKQMKKVGLIKRIGPNKGGHWEVIGSKD